MNTISKISIYLQMAALFVTATLPGSQASAATVSFHGSLEGIETAEIPGVQPAILSAFGNASHIGRFTFRLEGHVSEDLSSAFGTIQFIAANGDMIFGEFIGVATLIELPIIWIEENVTITGGTGRFAGVTGNLILKRFIDISTGFTAFTSGSFDGHIIK